MEMSSACNRFFYILKLHATWFAKECRNVAIIIIAPENAKKLDLLSSHISPTFR